MNCSLSDKQRKEGMRCRSFDCIPCKEYLTSNDRAIIDNEIIKMLNKEIERLKLEVKHGCSICALQPEVTIRELESKLKQQQEVINDLRNTNSQIILNKNEIILKNLKELKAQQELTDEFNKDRRRLYKELTRLNDLLCNGYIYYDDTTESVISQYIETGKRARQALAKIKQESEK